PRRDRASVRDRAAAHPVRHRGKALRALSGRGTFRSVILSSCPASTRVVPCGLEIGATMTIYEISYRSFFSNRKFNITENGNPAGGFERSFMGGAGTISLGNVAYTVTRESLLSGVYVIETGGARVATARKPNMLHRTHTIESGGKIYALEARR